MKGSKATPERAPTSVPAARAVRPGLGFFAGLRYPWRGARFVYVEHPGLVRLWLPPVLITFGLLVGASWFAIDVHDQVTQWLWATPSGADFFAGARRFAHTLLGWIVGLALLAAGFVGVALANGVVAAPFNDALSEAVECIVQARTAPRFGVARLLRDVVRTIGLELLKLSAYAAVMLPLLLLGLVVPAIGPVLQGVIGFVFTALYFAIDHVDWAASRRDLSARQRFRWAFRHLRAMLGLGAGVWLLLFVPILNLLFMPAAVAGATLMFLDLAGPAPERNRGVPPPA